MAHRTPNFYAGPAALPLAALERAQRELVDFEGTGLSIMEHSHRGPSYEAVHREAMALLRELLSVPDDYHVLLLQGGARQQFAMVPLNLLRPGRSADYVITGNWGIGAHSEAALVGEARVVVDTKQDGTYTRVPASDELTFDPEATYVHITSNNTLYGTQWDQSPERPYPDTGEAPLVADMTSDLLCRPIDVSRFGLIYAGAQKNVGPAGITVVIVQKRLVDRARDDIPEVFRYASHAGKDSLWNTPPAFAIYMLRNTLAVLKEMGGAPALAERNRAKSAALYERIDAHPEFFRSPVERASRSMMNVVFRLPSEELERRFLEEAKATGMLGLEGHRKVGGLRASVYNAVEPAWVERLGALMDDFHLAHG
jgi:phosphoserine aminotransferase